MVVIMKNINDFCFWFLTGSQHLYGEEALLKVKEDSRIMVDYLNDKGNLPCKIVLKSTLVDASSIEKTILEAELDTKCGGVICWMHTFSPAKMWINGLNKLTKPMLQINTQFNRSIPYKTMDMDFMNLNQSAHGDREFGYITARMNIPRNVIVGYWKDSSFQKRMSNWMRAAATTVAGRNLTVLRFGDNMRNVAVTCGDKVEAYIKLGWNVPYFGIGDLVDKMKEVSTKDVDKLMEEYSRLYEFNGSGPSFLEHVREQAKMEIGIERILIENEAEAFCTNFEDLHGLKQLPGLACQHLMQKGYGFAGEGDWKTAAMVRTLKMMGEGLEGGCSFMEDYTYNLEEGDECELGAHMLEVCPSITDEKPKIVVSPLGIGDKEDPARLVFTGKAGDGFTLSIVDIGGRLRAVLNEVKLITPPEEFLKLPVARALWKPLPNFITSSECWILSGAGHHNTLSTAVERESIIFWSEMNSIELLTIGKGTTVESFRMQDRWNRAAYR